MRLKRIAILLFGLGMLVAVPIAAPLVALQRSAAEYRNIQVGEDGFTGCD